MRQETNDNPIKGEPWCINTQVLKPGTMSLGVGTILGHTDAGKVIVLWADGVLMECLERKALVRYTTEKPK